MNSLVCKVFLSWFLTQSLSFASSLDWKWVGFEVIGNKKVSRDQILSQIPLKIGTLYRAESKKWEAWCEAIKKSFDFLYTNCSAVRYHDFKAFLIVEIVEKGDEFRLAFRENPEKTIELANSEILQEFDALHRRMIKLFEGGQAPVGRTLSSRLNSRKAFSGTTR